MTWPSAVGRGPWAVPWASGQQPGPGRSRTGSRDPRTKNAQRGSQPSFRRRREQGARKRKRQGGGSRRSSAGGGLRAAGCGVRGLQAGLRQRATGYWLRAAGRRLQVGVGGRWKRRSGEGEEGEGALRLKTGLETAHCANGGRYEVRRRGRREVDVAAAMIYSHFHYPL
jgi:hypothetical protein